MLDEKEKELVTFIGMKDANFSLFLKYAIFQALKSQLEDITKFALAVENIETLLMDRLDDEYFEKVKRKWEELDEEYGTREENRAIKLKEFAAFKFRELIKFLKQYTPEDLEAKL